MAKYVVENIREETPEEKAVYDWFQTQSLASPDSLEQAARLIIGLVTGLLGALFGVLTVASNPLPAYLHDSTLRLIGAIAVMLFLFSLIASLAVVFPRRWTFNPAQPASQVAVFQKILERKSSALLVATIAFGAGILALAIVLVIVLLTIT
jgi:hypothetical protein